MTGWNRFVVGSDEDEDEADELGYEEQEPSDSEDLAMTELAHALDLEQDPPARADSDYEPPSSAASRTDYSESDVDFTDTGSEDEDLNAALAASLNFNSNSAPTPAPQGGAARPATDP